MDSCQCKSDLVYSYSTISFHRKNTNTRVCVKAGNPVAFHYEDFSQQLLSKTEYSLPRLLQDQFLIEFESWALNEEERTITEYLGNKNSWMNCEAGKGKRRRYDEEVHRVSNEPNYSETY